MFSIPFYRTRRLWTIAAVELSKCKYFVALYDILVFNFPNKIKSLPFKTYNFIWTNVENDLRDFLRLAFVCFLWLSFDFGRVFDVKTTYDPKVSFTRLQWKIHWKIEIGTMDFHIKLIKIASGSKAVTNLIRYFVSLSFGWNGELNGY